MKTMMMIPASLCYLLSGLGSARADVAVGVSAQLVVAPPVPAPSILPVVPVQLPPPPVPVYSAPTVVASTPATAGGQWIHTVQYGWVYMPYGSRYVVTHASGPYSYVYYPSYGWRWIASPWVVGTGPYPYFGAHGPYAYGWFKRLRHAHHPMAAHYTRPGHRPVLASHASPHTRPVHAARSVGPQAPARAVAAPRPVARSYPAVTWQRNHAAPNRITLARHGARR